MKLFAFADEASEYLDNQIAAMRRNGLNGIEIRNVDGENIADISAAKAGEIRKKLDAAGLAVWSLGSPIGKIPIDGDFRAHLEKLRHTLEIGQILGAPHIRLFSFYLPQGSDFDRYADEVADKVGQMAEICHAAGILPCHENEKGIFGDTVSRCEWLYRQLPALKAVFDPANFIQCGEDTAAGWQRLRPYVQYLHIKDAEKSGRVVLPGTGAGNLRAILHDYRQSGGEAVTVEPHLMEFVGLGDLEHGEKTVIESRYSDNDEAFDAACTALKKILEG